MLARAGIRAVYFALRVWLEQVITDLLSNAHAYTPRGGRMAITAANEDDPQKPRLILTERGVGYRFAK